MTHILKYVHVQRLLYWITTILYNEVCILYCRIDQVGDQSVLVQILSS